ncbi:hypothetical protein [Micromonospora sp. NPDC048830]|uniref:hypothetical protein n=1 Tax=Micromonospora sp. NPDC048830 TaxID=3364257 RepID=UPI00371E7192
MGAAVMPECPEIDLTCQAAETIIDNTTGRYFDQIAEQASKAAAEMLKTLVTGWLSLSTPDVSQGSCRLDGARKLDCSSTVAYLREYTTWAVAAIAVAAVLIAAIKMALERDGREAGSFAKGLVTMVVLAVAGVPGVQLLIGIGDEYANWILSASADGDLGKRLLLLAPAPATTGMPALVVAGISLMIFLSTMVQLLLLLARNAGLVLLAGLLPLAASAGISGSGRSIRDRYLTWLLALVLYKPAAATIYAAVFWLIGKGQSLTDLLTGLVMFCMAIVALPALMRLIAPAVSVLSTGGSGVAVAAGSAAGQVASGAVRLIGDSRGKSSRAGNSGGPGRPGGAAPSAPVPRPASSGARPGTAAGPTTAAAGPVGLAAAAGVEGAKAGPTVVRKVGGTASGSTAGEGS